MFFGSTTSGLLIILITSLSSSYTEKGKDIRAQYVNNTIQISIEVNTLNGCIRTEVRKNNLNIP